MRLLLSMVLALVAVTALLPVLQRLGERDGAPASVVPSSTSRAQQGSPAETATPAEETRTETGYLYIWRDKEGVHIESLPPPEGVQVEVIPFERSVAVGEPPTDAARAKTASVTDESLPSSEVNPMSVYTPEGFEELLEHIDRTAGELKAREELLESLQDEL